jgi:hypothetical protein
MEWAALVDQAGKSAHGARVEHQQEPLAEFTASAPTEA